MTEKIPIHISRELYNKIQKKVKLSQGEFKNAEDYVEFVLNEVTGEEDGPRQIFTPKEEEEIKKRLKSLGYL